LAPTGFASFSEPSTTQVRTLNSSRSCLKVVETFRRLETWAEYVEQVLKVRELVLINFKHLAGGLIRYLQRRDPVDIINGCLDSTQWDKCSSNLNSPPVLPKCAVDPRGFVSEASSERILQTSESQNYNPRPLILRKHETFKAFLKAERSFFGDLFNFFFQAPHVMTANYHLGRVPPWSPLRNARVTALKERKIHTDWAHLTTMNFASARKALPEYQSTFRQLFASRLAPEKLADLEAQEWGLISTVWQLWYFYANNPGQEWADPAKQIPQKFAFAEREIETKLLRAITDAGTQIPRITKLQGIGQWAGEPTQWLRLDIDNPKELYKQVEELILVMRRGFGKVEFTDLAYYVMEKKWRYIALVPVVRGHMLNQLAWRLFIHSTLLTDEKIDEKPWSYMMQPIPGENWARLGLTVWQDDEIDLANRLSESVAALSLVIAQISDFHGVPEMIDSALPMVQAHLSQKSVELSTHLQAALDVITAMAQKFNQPSLEDQIGRENLREVIAELPHLHRLILPTEGFDGEYSFHLGSDDLTEYNHRLSEARSLAEGVRLYWIQDALDQLPHRF